MNWKSIFLATAALVLLLQGSGKADLVVFGDSLSDVGNTADATFGAIPSSSDGYFQGRFTNGNVWVEHLAGYLGESVPTSSRNGGKNFAHGGAQVLDSGLLRPSLTEQVSGLGSANGGDLYVIWAGGNDLLSVDLDTSIDAQRLRSRQVAAGINANIDTLYALGARRFLVLNLPDLGATPLTQVRETSDNIQDLSDLTINFNRELAQEMRKARDDNNAIEITEIDVHGIFEDLMANPGAFGLSNVTDSATPFDPDGSAFFPAGLATDLPGAGINPDEYLFYDGLHPTARAHELLATRVASVMSVPEPSHFMVLSMGAVVFAAYCFRRRRREDR